ncbi:MAG: hypothetical protein LWY06_00130, partial [Firmicutes bacterium]|nr:hypothetical protein [Bacillota bacterium]
PVGPQFKSFGKEVRRKLFPKKFSPGAGCAVIILVSDQINPCLNSWALPLSPRSLVNLQFPELGMEVWDYYKTRIKGINPILPDNYIRLPTHKELFGL